MNAHVQSPAFADPEVWRPKLLVPKVIEETDKPAWMYGKTRFTAHVDTFRAWKQEQSLVGGHPIKRYIRQRAFEMGLTYTAVISRSRREHILLPRDQIIYEIRNGACRRKVSFPQLGQFFGGRDHSSMYSACQRAAMRLGDPKAFNTVMHKRMMGKLRHEAKRAA